MYKVGDTIRILDADMIECSESNGLKTGDVYEVVNIDSSGDPEINPFNLECSLCFYPSELEYIEKVEDDSK